MDFLIKVYVFSIFLLLLKNSQTRQILKNQPKNLFSILILIISRRKKLNVNLDDFRKKNVKKDNVRINFVNYRVNSLAEFDLHIDIV